MLLESAVESWDFRTANTKEYTHCYHNYPAMMIPQIARRLISMYGSPKRGLLFDPYCGSGTTLVEGLLSGYEVIGTDINPLAAFISRVKCATPDPLELHIALKRILSRLAHDADLPTSLPVFKNLDFWFSRPATIGLAALKQSILEECPDAEERDFFLLAFSETVRDSSRTKPGEFKLVRKKPNGSGEILPLVPMIFQSKVLRNLRGLSSYIDALPSNGMRRSSSIHTFNTVNRIPQDLVPVGSIDLLITSPPYGDSATTVAYGQFSRLSSQWLGFEDAMQVDKQLMGGYRVQEIRRFDHSSLDAAIMRIANENIDRAKIVADFYSDLEASCNHVAKVVKQCGYVCYVTSNRQVQGMVLPTDAIVSEFFRRNGYHEIEKFSRMIPNKRMPSKNSPSNISGVVADTMSQESIIVMQRRTFP